MKIKNYKELAKIAGCGVGTISRYFSGGSISTEMRERIKAILNQNDFLLKKNHCQANVNLLIFDKITTWTFNILQFLTSEFTSNNITWNLILVNEDRALLVTKLQMLAQQPTAKTIIFNSYDEEVTNLFDQYAAQDNIMFFGHQSQKLPALYFNFEKIMYELVMKVAQQSKNILYLSLGNEWKSLYRGYFKASNVLNLTPNYFVLAGNNFETDLTKLTNLIIDKHLKTIICADEESYFLVKNLKNMPVEIINVNFNPTIINSYLNLELAINVNFKWVINQLTLFLTADPLLSTQQEIPVEIII